MWVGEKLSKCPDKIRHIASPRIRWFFGISRRAIWMLVAMVIAVRQALDYHGTGRAIAVCLMGWLVQVVIIVLVMIFLGIGVGPQP